MWKVMVGSNCMGQLPTEELARKLFAHVCRGRGTQTYDVQLVNPAGTIVMQAKSTLMQKSKKSEPKK